MEVKAMRKLVTLRRIARIDPIPNADAIEKATIDGWEVVVKKGMFAEGDHCVYFEIDSLLPILDPRFSFLVKGGQKVHQDGLDYIKLKTIRLRGQLSQGLALPVAEFTEITSHPIEPGTNYSETLYSVNFSEHLGVVIHEPPIPAQLKGQAKGYFPSWIRRTDQERIQNMPEVLLDTVAQYEVTIKLDGTSMTVFRNGDEIGVCSRNLQLIETPDNTMWQIAHESGLIDLLKSNTRNLAIQGELIGPKIQGNPEDLKAPEFHIFDIWDIDQQAYLSFEARHDWLSSHLSASAKHVPLVHIINLSQFKGQIANILAYAEGPSLNLSKQREGIVFKRLDGGASFKVISNAYLLKDKT
jgi:RNA ligase (TIGR02306 family)